MDKAFHAYVHEVLCVSCVQSRWNNEGFCNSQCDTEGAIFIQVIAVISHILNDKLGIIDPLIITMTHNV